MKLTHSRTPGVLCQSACFNSFSDGLDLRLPSNAPFFNNWGGPDEVNELQ
jgi:hypothetical protein